MHYKVEGVAMLSQGAHCDNSVELVSDYLTTVACMECIERDQCGRNFVRNWLLELQDINHPLRADPSLQADKKVMKAWYTNATQLGMPCTGHNLTNGVFTVNRNTWVEDNNVTASLLPFTVEQDNSLRKIEG